jgi:hypothetical protein
MVHSLAICEKDTQHTICIPRIKNNISKQFVFRIFCDLKIGFIEKVIEIPLKNDEFHKRVILKIKWNHSDYAKLFCSRFDKRQDVKVMYSEPSYWKCVSNYVRHYDT